MRVEVIYERVYEVTAPHGFTPARIEHDTPEDAAEHVAALLHQGAMYVNVYRFDREVAAQQREDLSPAMGSAS